MLPMAPIYAVSPRPVTLNACASACPSPSSCWPALARRPRPRPARPADFAAFLRTLIGRYGPQGSFWAEHPDLPRVPVRAWQVWNEESGPFFWDDGDRGRFPAERHRWVRPYLKLLRAAHDAIRAA